MTDVISFISASALVASMRTFVLFSSIVNNALMSFWTIQVIVKLSQGFDIAKNDNTFFFNGMEFFYGLTPV